MDNDKATDFIRKASPSLIEAGKLDEDGKINDAINKYNEGIDFLTTAMRLMDTNHKKYEEVEEKIAMYQKRKEELEEECHFENPFEIRKISETSTGHGYNKIFGKCCDCNLKSVEIYEPFIRTEHQVALFIQFCELVISSSQKLRRIVLETHPDSEDNDEAFRVLRKSCQTRGVEFQLKYVKKLHDRGIKFNPPDGWRIKPGRGLEIYYPARNSYSLGANELNFRQCRLCDIEIFMPMSHATRSKTRADIELRKASAIFMKAVYLDQQQKFNDALTEFQKGVDLLSAVSMLLTEDNRKYDEVKQRLPEYQDRIEQLKRICFVEENHEVRKIEEDSTGHGYDKVFEKCCDNKLKNVVVYEKDLSTDQQIKDFVRFCELVVLLSGRLKTITLNTGLGSGQNDGAFEKLTRSLENRSIALQINKTVVSDNQILFDNGWKVQNELGLGYLKPPTEPYVLGTFDTNFRLCRATTIHIFKENRD